MTDIASTTTRAYFVIWGKRCDPEKISAMTRLSPTKTWRVGDIRNERTQTHHEDSGWRLDSDGAADLGPDAHIALLIEKIWAARDDLRTVGATSELQFTVVIHCRKTMPPIHLSRDALKCISRLGAAVDIDVYCR